jgi:hypothetical protein
MTLRPLRGRSPCVRSNRRCRERPRIAFERAELATDAAERQRLLTFAIVAATSP